MQKFGIGQAVRRKEDERFLTGTGKFTDDLNLDGQAYAAFVRSPHAHARIGEIDTEAAKSAPGVIAVCTGRDLPGEGPKILPCVAEPVINRDGSETSRPMRPLLQSDFVRYVGDPVAVVIAETQAAARDAADLVEVDYEPIDAVIDMEAAVAADAPQIWPECPGNMAFDWEMGDPAGVEEAIKGAAHVTRLKLTNNRLVANTIEPRAAVATYDDESGRYTLHAPTQGAQLTRDMSAMATLGVEPDKLRIVTPDVGGSFGMKGFPYPEPYVAAHAAKALGRPVKWTADRAESFLSDNMARDHVTEAEMAFDKDGRIVALRVRNMVAMGAYLSAFNPMIATIAPAGIHLGPFAIPNFYLNAKGVFTNTTPVDAYRGAGQPEATLVTQRLLNVAARELDIPIEELHRRNFIPGNAFPYTNVAERTIDSGDFEGTMNKALDISDWSDFEKRRQEAATRGKLAGIGLCYYVESTGGAPQELSRIDIAPDGDVLIQVGNKGSGQGHETAYAQIVAERLGVPFEQIRCETGDSDALPTGGFTGGSGGTALAGKAFLMASDNLVDNARERAADELEVAAADIEFADGQFVVKGTDRAITLMELAAKGDALSGEALNQEMIPSYPNGCHVCEVEVDRETGEIKIVRYSIVEDIGKVINPLIVEGQVHGGTVQGLGQAMGEHAIYDTQSGQLLTGSFMDYWMPRADDFPSFKVDENPVPCTTSELGVKGCGEAGATGAPPAFVNAVVDALKDYGVMHIDMPVTGHKVWQILHDAKRAA